MVERAERDSNSENSQSSAHAKAMDGLRKSIFGLTMKNVLGIDGLIISANKWYALGHILPGVFCSDW